MSKQVSLPFDQVEHLETLWPRFPEQGREQLVVLYAGLIARSVRAGVGPTVPPTAPVPQGLVGQAATDGTAPGSGKEVCATGSPAIGLDSPEATAADVASSSQNAAMPI